MPKLNHIAVTALKDDVLVVTARKKLRYQKIEGLPNGGMPEEQEEFYEQKHGLSLAKDQSIEIDVTDEQLAEFQAAVDRGELEVLVHRQAQAVNVVALEKAPTPKKDETPKKDDKK